MSTNHITFLDYTKMCEELWFKELVSSEIPLGDKMTNVVTYIQWPTQVIDLYQSLIKSLIDIVRKKFFRCKVEAMPFGSITNGLYINGSDADIALTFNDCAINSNKLLHLLRSLFGNHPTLFKECFCISKARVPLLKLTHTWGLKFDVCINNTYLCKYNSELLQFYASLSPRIKEMFIIIKALIKAKNVQGKQWLSSYGVNLLILFSLQQQKLIPSVYALQSRTDERRIIDGWDASFTMDSNIFPGPENLNLLDMLLHFFTFYSKFNFALNIVSVYVGRSIFMPDFSNPSDEFSIYKNTEIKLDINAFAVVQDPFIHNFNAMKALTRTTLVNFQQFCEESAQLCSNVTEGLCNEGDFLWKFFSTTTSNPNESQLNNKTPVAIIYMGPVWPFGENEEETFEIWKQNLLIALIETLRRVALYEVSQIDDHKLECKVSYSVLDRRERTTVIKSIDPLMRLTNFKKSEYISQTLYSSDNKNIILGKNSFTFNLRYSFKSVPPSMVLSFDSGNPKCNNLLNPLRYILSKCIEEFITDVIMMKFKKPKEH